MRRHYGAVIVKNDEVISTGYVGAPRGRKNCSDLGYCIRQQLNIPRGERYELCRSVHVDIDSGEYRRKIDTKTVRRNVALPSWLNYEAEHAGINVSRVLQEALMKVLNLEHRR